jgi:hypothetical protein
MHKHVEARDPIKRSAIVIDREKEGKKTTRSHGHAGTREGISQLSTAESHLSDVDLNQN